MALLDKELLCQFPSDSGSTWYVYVDGTFSLSVWNSEDDKSWWELREIDGITYFFWKHSEKSEFETSHDDNDKEFVSEEDQLFIENIQLALAIREMVGDHSGQP